MVSPGQVSPEMNFTLDPFHKSRDTQTPNHDRVTTTSTASSVTIIYWLTSLFTWPARGAWADSPSLPDEERAIDYVS